MVMDSASFLQNMFVNGHNVDKYIPTKHHSSRGFVLFWEIFFQITGHTMFLRQTTTPCPV